jgi:hypothetical protein
VELTLRARPHKTPEDVSEGPQGDFGCAEEALGEAEGARVTRSPSGICPSIRAIVACAGRP